MSCSVPAFAYIQDVNRIVSFLKDFPSTSEQNVKDNTGAHVLSFMEQCPLRSLYHNSVLMNFLVLLTAFD